MVNSEIYSAGVNNVNLILQGRVRQKKLVKIYHLYTHRFLPKARLWGSFANLSAHDVYFSFDDACSAAEIKRIQGANFRIAETPAVWVESLTHGVVISELFSAKPCRSLVEAKISIPHSSIGKVLKLREQLTNQKWILWDTVRMGPKTVPSDRKYKIYKSHLTGTSVPIQWSASSLDIDDTYVGYLVR